MVKTKKHIAIFYCTMLASSIAIVSCTNIVDPPSIEDHGIPVYNLEIDNDDYGTFVTNEFSNLRVYAELKVNGETYDVMIKHHGFSSRGNYKKNYSLEYDTSDPILGKKEVVLSGQALDPSLLRSYLAAEIFNHSGIATFTLSPVELCINEESCGLYLAIEKIDEEFFTKRNIEAAELYKAIYGNAKFTFQENKDVRFGFEKRFPEDDNYYSLEQLIQMISSASYERFPLQIEEVFDVEGYLRYMAASVLMCNQDGIIHNFQMYKDKRTGKYKVIPWDLDSTFGYEAELCAFPGKSDLLTRLLEYPHYREMYSNIYRELLNNYFNADNLGAKIDEMSAIISSAYSHDRWLTAKGYDLDTEVIKLKEFIAQRSQHIEDQLETFSY